MNLREQQNIFSLLIEGLRLVNRSATVLLVYIVFTVVIHLLLLLLQHYNFPILLIKLANFFIGAFLTVLLVRILAAKADNFGESFSNSLSASIVPTFYFLVFSVIIGVASGVLTLVAAPTVAVLGFLGVAVVGLIAFFLIVRLSCCIPALVLRDQGPVKAILYSWEMTRGAGAFFKTLGMLLLCGALPILFAAGVARALYVIIPLHFADSFNLAALTPQWYAVGIGITVCFVLVFAWSAAAFILFFLNCDYGENRSSYTPLPQAQLTGQTTQVFGENNNVLPPGVGKTVTAADVPQVEVVQSSIKTISNEPDLKEHLNEVYKPSKENTIQYSEEDRMPTILFDDEMAKQVAENQKMWATKKKTNQPKEDTDFGQSIKMSK